MAKRHKPEEIITKLRQVDVLVSQGSSVADAVRSIGVTEVTSYRWRQGYGGLKSDQVKRVKELETENSRLRKAIADLRRKLVRRLAHAGSTFSGVRASDKPGAVQVICADPLLQMHLGKQRPAPAVLSAHLKLPR